MACSTFLRPYFSAGLPAIMEPSTVPINADATVKPCEKSSNDHNSWMDFSTPDITAVSNPKRKPPRAATKAYPNDDDFLIEWKVVSFYKRSGKPCMSCLNKLQIS